MQTIPKHLLEKIAGQNCRYRSKEGLRANGESRRKHLGGLRGSGVGTLRVHRPRSSRLGGNLILLALVESLGSDDFVPLLILGVLLRVPAGGVNLVDEQAGYTELVNPGAPIGNMNTVRKHLSFIKVGQLAAKGLPATMQSLTISDVAGDDPADIASGPTIGENTDAAAASEIVETYGMYMPDSAVDVLNRASHVVPAGDPWQTKVTNKIISALSMSLVAAQHRATPTGIESCILGDAIEGAAHDAAN